MNQLVSVSTTIKLREQIMKRLSIMVILAGLLQTVSATANTTVFPKDVACGPSDYTGRVAWIIEADGQRIVSLKRPSGEYLCDLSTEASGSVTCTTMRPPLGSMPNKIDVVFSATRQKWIIKILAGYNYVCDKS
jgi:hypothetical protein